MARMDTNALREVYPGGYSCPFVPLVALKKDHENFVVTSCHLIVRAIRGFKNSKRLSPETVSEVSKRTVRFYTVEALIGSTLFQCTEGFAVRTYFDVIKCSRVKTLR